MNNPVIFSFLIGIGLIELIVLLLYLFLCVWSFTSVMQSNLTNLQKAVWLIFILFVPLVGVTAYFIYKKLSS
jgi:hypothetical protein